MHRCLLWEVLLLEGDCNGGFDHNRRFYHGLAGAAGWLAVGVVHVVILAGRSPLGDRGRQSMRCAPHLASSTRSVPRRDGDGTGWGKWLAGVPLDASTGGCAVRVPHHGQRQHASNTGWGYSQRRTQFPLSPGQADTGRRVQLRFDATYIISHQQGTLPTVLGRQYPTQARNSSRFFSPFIQGTKRGDRQVVFPVGLLVRNGADRRRAGDVPSLHSMPAGLAIQFPPTQGTDGIISMYRAWYPVWFGLVLGGVPQVV